MEDLLGPGVDAAQQVLEPLLRLADDPAALDPILAAVGIDLQALTGLDAAGFVALIGDAETALDDLAGITSLDDIAAIAELLDAVRKAIDAGRKVFGSLDVSTLPTELRDVWHPAVERLVALLVTGWLNAHAPVLAQVLILLGIVTAQDPAHPDAVVATDGRAYYVPLSTPHVDVRAMLHLIRDPEEALSLLWFGTPTPPSGAVAVDALVAKLWPMLGSFAQALDLPLILGGDPRLVDPADAGTSAEQWSTQSVVANIGGTDGPITAVLTLLAGENGGRSSALLSVDGEVSVVFDAGRWHLGLDVSGGPARFSVDTAGAISVLGGQHLAGTVRLVGAGTADDPFVRVGPPAGTHLDVASLGVQVGGSFAADSHDVRVEVEATGLSITVDVGDGDRFLQRVIGALLPKPLEITADVVMGWRWQTGTYLRVTLRDSPATNLRIDIPIGLSIGPVQVPRAHVALVPKLGTDSSGAARESLQIDVTIDAHAMMGPVSATVTEIGARLSFAETSGGNLGSLTTGAAFRPPTGVGVSLQAPTVSGAGYLAFDADAGRYAGAIQLSFSSLSPSAVGLVTTKLPNNQPGFSMVVLISVHFPPVQLGFGISLTGIGGAVAINRTIAVDTLRAGLSLDPPIGWVGERVGT